MSSSGGDILLEESSSSSRQKKRYSHVNITQSKPRISFRSFDRPFQLVRVNPSGEFEVCEEAAAILNEIQSNIGVVSIGGPARCGKSLILNFLKKSRGSGFTVGNTTKACTQGIWLWGEPIQNNGMVTLLLDSEGTTSLKKSENFDGKIFALLILLSSIFIYNSKGAIDERAVNELSMASYLSDILKGKNKRLSPKFLWLLRDFHLELAKEDGTAMTENEYLEDLLRHGGSTKNSKFYEIRNMLFSLFSDRECLTLPFPVSSDKELLTLENKSLSSLRSNFQRDFAKLKSMVIDNCPVKVFEGSPVNGRTLIKLLRVLVQSINDGVLPNIQGSWETVLKSHYAELLENMQKLYLQCRELDGDFMPYEEIELIRNLHAAKDMALDILRKNTIRDDKLDKQTRKSFQKFYDRDYSDILGQNYKSSEELNQKVLKKTFSSILKGVDSEADPFEIENRWNECLQKFDKKAKGPSKFKDMSEFTRNNQYKVFSQIFHSIHEKNQEEKHRRINKKIEGDQKQIIAKQEADVYNNNIRILTDHVLFI